MTRSAPLDMAPDEFRRLGHDLVERIAGWIESLPTSRVAGPESPAELRAVLGERGLPEDGADAETLLARASELLFEHSTRTSNPRFWGYINGCAAPIGILGEFLAAALNQNASSWHVSPMATEIESQVIRWIAELVGCPGNGGILVSGGNEGNFVGLWAARRAKFGPELRQQGNPAGGTLYCSTETHTWVQKAADLSGLGTDAIRWVPVDDRQRLDVGALRTLVAADRAAGRRPFCVVGTAGTVSTGAIDPLAAMAEFCRAEDLWLHVDGAYGAPAAALPDAPPDLKALAGADSIALDPHKWLYVPIEAGCALVRDPRFLRDTFLFQPSYYHSFVEPDVAGKRTNFNELGPQNTRGFRALKVWLALQSAGRRGYVKMLGEDIALAKALAELAAGRAELEVGPQSLSIATFRYAPPDLARAGEARIAKVNRALLARLKSEGRAYVSHALVADRLFLRACIVNFRTSRPDLELLVDEVCRLGRTVEQALDGTPA